MKIAIVAPHPVPFALGGAENLQWGMQTYIENQSPHICDIVSLASPEGSLSEVVASYEAFFRLDLGNYDCVISGKYPAWMINHPNHICYMLHRLRGLYDTYSGVFVDKEQLPHAPLRALLRWMREIRRSEVNIDKEILPEFFDRFRALDTTKIPEGLFAFPGPLAREIVHFLDEVALLEGRIQRHAAISKTVAGRRGYFPQGVPVEILYPPPHRDDYRCGGDDYLFVSSRLDGPKRIALLIEAMQYVTEDIPLIIAGTGPDEVRLRRLAETDPRIHFLGFVADADMPALYADALAIPFVPYDEDYGLVTIEAMRSGKPVLTCSDSGGPKEFVRHGETGFVMAPEPESIADKICYLCRHRDEARVMGANARKAVEGVSWERVLKGLFEKATPARNIFRKRPKLTVATTFPIWPPMGGGQARVFHLYGNLAHHFDIDIVTLGASSATQSQKEIAPGMLEIRVPKSQSHLAYEQELSAAVHEVPIGDIGAFLLTRLTPAFRRALQMSSLTSDAVIACHPYLINEIKAAAPGKPFWYEAQDVEYELKRMLLELDGSNKELLETVKTAESLCWRGASHVFACAQRDLKALRTLYGSTRAYLHEVPNGVALDEVRFVAYKRRSSLQQYLGLADRSIALFMGSWHGPNLEAVEKIIAAATILSHVDFVIIGSSCKPFQKRILPSNIHMLGQVEPATRNSLFAIADVALNPMRSGSGTNLKMLDYFAAGIPVISSHFGARGLKAEADRHFVLAEENCLAGAICSFFKRDEDAVDKLITEARILVEAYYSWSTIADNFSERLTTTGFGMTGDQTDKI